MFNYLKVQLSRLINEERGVTSVEYAVMIGLVALAVVALGAGLGGSVTGILQEIQTALEAL